MRRTLALVGCLLGLAPGTALAQTTVQSSSPPTGGDVVLAFDAATDLGGHDWQHGSGMAIDVGQTFRLAAPIELDKVTLKIRAFADLGGELVTVLVGTYSDPDDASMDEVLRIDVGALPWDLPVGEVRYVTFDLDYPVGLSAHRQYGVVVGFTGGGHVNTRAEILHLGGDVYPDGQAVAHLGAFVEGLKEDLVFFLHAASETPPPPPPPPPAGAVLSLHDGRFRVEAYWQTLFSTEGWAQAVAMTDQSGCFWFFHEENLELFVKVLDGCAVNERYWVFLAGLTDVEVTVVVHDLVAETLRVYHNPMGRDFVSLYDTASFATCP